MTIDINQITVGSLFRTKNDLYDICVLCTVFQDFTFLIGAANANPFKFTTGVKITRQKQELKYTHYKSMVFEGSELHIVNVKQYHCMYSPPPLGGSKGVDNRANASSHYGI